MATTNDELKSKLNEVINSIGRLHDKVNILHDLLKTTPPPIPPDPPDIQIVVTLKKAPLRELKRYNKKGGMVMRIHGGLRNRIKAQAGEYLGVVGDAIKVDGFRNYVYRLLPRQLVNNKNLPPKSDSTARHPVTKETDKDFFILARHVRV